MPHKTTSLIPQKRLAMPFHVFRGYPCLWPFVVLTLSPFSFSCISCFSWLNNSCLFVPIRVHSWFKICPNHGVSCVSCFSWLTPVFAHSWSFVSIRGSKNSLTMQVAYSSCVRGGIDCTSVLCHSYQEHSSWNYCSRLHISFNSPVVFFNGLEQYVEQLLGNFLCQRIHTGKYD